MARYFQSNCGRQTVAHAMKQSNCGPSNFEPWNVIVKLRPVPILCIIHIPKNHSLLGAYSLQDPFSINLLIQRFQLSLLSLPYLSFLSTPPLYLPDGFQIGAGRNLAITFRGSKLEGPQFDILHIAAE